MASYREALRLRPAYALVHYNLANVYVQLRHWSEARSSLAEALRLDPTMAPARDLLERLQTMPE
jgi:tetratricopeptide (TPR) repeat protein